MATDGERNKALRRERARQRRRMTAIQRDTAAEVTRQLETARARIDAMLAAGVSDFEAFRLPALRRAIDAALAELAREAAASMTAGARASFEAGIDMVEAPIDAGLVLDRPGFRLAAILPEVDRRSLAALSEALTGRIHGITLAAADRINGELAQMAIGAQDLTATIAKVGVHLQKGGRSRALTVIRTELGRAHSVAAQQRLDQAGQVLPGLKKQWRRSGKRFSRMTHDLADGQIVARDEPFLVAGERLRFPRDPLGSPGNTINCGCTVLPVMESWTVATPGRKEFSDAERAADPRKRLTEEALAAG